MLSLRNPVSTSGETELSVLDRITSLSLGDGRWLPPVAEPAATVVIARPALDPRINFEVVMLRRVSTMKFAANKAVFPGGRVDPIDHTQPNPLTACAIREVREEVGISVSELVPWDHWITPECEARRYDVHFFLTVIDRAADARLSTTEANEMLWIPPERAVARSKEGSLSMLRPTQVVLEDLAGIKTIDELRERALNREIYPRLPRPVIDDQGSIRWHMVHGYTEEIVDRDVGGADMESTGERLP